MQLTDNSRNVVVFMDGAAKEFVAICDPKYLWRIHVYENGKLTPLPNGIIPGYKHAGLSMEQIGADLIVWVCARITNKSGDPFPSIRHVIPNVCTPRRKVLEDLARSVYKEMKSLESSRFVKQEE